MMFPNDNCAVIAFYGLDANKKAICGWYKNSLDWFAKFNCQPEIISFEGPGFSKKVVSFKREHNRFTKIKQPQIEGFVLFALIPGAQIPCTDWKVASEVSLQGPSCASFAAAPSVFSLEDKVVLELARDMITFLRPNYGIGFCRERKRGPNLFVLGLNMGDSVFSGPEYEEGVRNGRWGYWGMDKEVYRQGILRDIFPLNFLTESQLSSKVHDLSLRKWIGARPNRGILEPFSNSMFLWKVNQSCVAEIRQELWDAGKIFTGIPDEDYWNS